MTVVGCQSGYGAPTYMGTRARPWSEDAELWCFKALSRAASLSTGGIVMVVVLMVMTEMARAGM